MGKSPVHGTSPMVIDETPGKKAYCQCGLSEKLPYRDVGRGLAEALGGHVAAPWFSVVRYEDVSLVDRGWWRRLSRHVSCGNCLLPRGNGDQAEIR
ncbi:MAG: hypothetical protein IID41_08670 [Planctomycetes bacterium]|nr:hypothetical protein [Planctomycetota bacterium]